MRQYFPSLAIACCLALIATAALSESLYKYRGENGEWIYADRPPDEGKVDEIRDLGPRITSGEVKVTHQIVGNSVVMTANNPYYAPVELELLVDEIRGIQFPALGEDLHWVLPAQSDTTLMRLALLNNADEPVVRFRFKYLIGDPGAKHRPPEAYRVPFSIASNFPVTQAHPVIVTHGTPDSMYAVDIAMPIGTDVFAARDGIVFDVAGNNFRGGIGPDIDSKAANVIRILHDDGTYAIYAHLNWNSIRVRPGDDVRRGDYIADSGNTGFSSGPHLHFAVVRNAGLKIESLPFVFKGANAEAVVPATGKLLTAY